MSRDLLDEIIKQTGQLTITEKHLLADHLLAEISQTTAAVNSQSALSQPSAAEELARRQQHIKWLKEHQREYAGKYVALDGYRLVAEGRTFPETHQAALKAGVKKPFITQVFPPDSTVFGGW
jgi:hypothetical protein